MSFQFAIIVVVLALALGAHCWAVPGIITAVHGPAGLTALGGPLVWGGAPAAVTIQSNPPVISPAVIASPPAVVAVQAAASGAHGGGTYVAQNRGAVHVAPLIGHVVSATSSNLQAPPGTV